MFEVTPSVKFNSAVVAVIPRRVWSAGTVIKIFLVPALKFTALVPLDPAKTVVRVRVLPVFHVPMPTSHSSVLGVVCATA